MQIIYRLLQVTAVVIWLVINTSCQSSRTSIPYHITSHAIILQLQPGSHAFLAHDTMAIEYEKGTTELYFFLDKDITVEDVSVGHQPLPFSIQDSLEHTPFASYQEILDQESVLYTIKLPPNFNPTQIEVFYHGEELDSLRDSAAMAALAGLAVSSTETQQKILFAENWYPKVPHTDAKFQLTVHTAGAEERLF